MPPHRSSGAGARPEPARLTLFGATGRIGRTLIGLLASSNFRGTIDVAARDRTKLDGLVDDVTSVNRDLEFRFHGPTCPQAVAASDLVIVLAGRRPEPELARAYEAIDAGGRYVQAVANLDLIEQIGATIAAADSSTTTIVVTNQSDLLAGLLRRRSGLSQVFGFGNMLDSWRFRAASGSATGDVIGYHLDTHMSVAESTVSRCRRSDIVSGLAAARTAGRRISVSYRAHIGPGEQAGATYGPAVCLAACIRAFYGFAPPVVEPFNQAGAGPLALGGAYAEIGVGLPVRIADRRIVRADASIDLSRDELTRLRTSADEMSTMLRHLMEDK